MDYVFKTKPPVLTNPPNAAQEHANARYEVLLQASATPYAASTCVDVLLSVGRELDAIQDTYPCLYDAIVCLRRMEQAC